MMFKELVEFERVVKVLWYLQMFMELIIDKCWSLMKLELLVVPGSSGRAFRNLRPNFGEI